MRKIICGILAALLFCMTGCGGAAREAEPQRMPVQHTDGAIQETMAADTLEAAAESTAQETVEEPTDPLLDKFLEDWTNLLYLQELRLAQECDTLLKITEIGSEPTWEAYVYARAACAFTCEWMEQLAQKPAEMTMTETDYLQLVERDMDLIDVKTEFQIYNDVTLPRLKEKDNVVWTDNYMQNLMYGMYDESAAKVMVDSADLRYRTLQADMKYWYLVNNYILLELPEAYAEKLTQIAAARASQILSQYSTPFLATNDVLNEINSVLNLMEEYLIEEQEILTQWKILLNMQKFTPKEIAGLPTVVQFPESVSVDDWRVQYYWKEGEEIRTVGYPMELDSLPNCMYMTADQVTLQEYQRYILELEAGGLAPDAVNETAAMYELDGGLQMLISFEENTLTISVTGGQLCFAPLWYINALELRK